MPSEFEQSLNVQPSQADSPKERLQLVPDLPPEPNRQTEASSGIFELSTDPRLVCEVIKSYQERLADIKQSLGELAIINEVLLTYAAPAQPGLSITEQYNLLQDIVGTDTFETGAPTTLRQYSQQLTLLTGLATSDQLAQFDDLVELRTLSRSEQVDLLKLLLTPEQLEQFSQLATTEELLATKEHLNQLKKLADIEQLNQFNQLATSKRIEDINNAVKVINMSDAIKDKLTTFIAERLYLEQELAKSLRVPVSLPTLKMV